VVELGGLIACPYAALTLADMGARVVKIEPIAGEASRHVPPYLVGESALFLGLNRNKRSIAIDYRASAGLDAVHRLVAGADVVLQNFRPDVRDELGLDYESLVRRNPRIVSCSITAFGESAEWRTKAGVDTVFQAMSGLMATTGEVDGCPIRTASPIVDVAAGMSAAQGVGFALAARERTGAPQDVRVALIDVAISLMAPLASMHFAQHPPTRIGNASPFSIPSGLFQTADGEWLALSVFSDRFFERFTRALGCAELASDERFSTSVARASNRGQLHDVIGRVLADRPAAEWLTLLEAADVPASLVWSVEQVLESQLALANGMIAAVDHPTVGALRTLASPVRVGDSSPGVRPPPRLGEHTDEILAEVGLDAARIAVLRADGVIACASVP
jgi:formyl-CoA transferase/CoA:oxalate CoA-transferase